MSVPTTMGRGPRVPFAVWSDAQELLAAAEKEEEEEETSKKALGECVEGVLADAPRSGAPRLSSRSR
jgi:hypothetical protein